MSGEVTTDFLLDGSEIAEEIAGANVTSCVGPGLISEVSGTTRSVYHADGLGSTRAMSDSAEDVAAFAVYAAYGSLLVGNTLEFGYAGEYRYYSDTTELHYLKARYYDPTVGRFLSRDPIGHAGGLNLYAYCRNNPSMYVDPDGEFAWWIGCLLPCGSAIGRPIAIVLGCLAGGATNEESFKRCFGEMWCEEKGKTGSDAWKCALCLFVAGAKAIEPKLPPPWGTAPPVERIPFPRDVPLLDRVMLL